MESYEDSRKQSAFIPDREVKGIIKSTSKFFKTIANELKEGDLGDEETVQEIVLGAKFIKEQMDKILYFINPDRVEDKKPAQSLAFNLPRSDDEEEDLENKAEGGSSQEEEFGRSGEVDQPERTAITKKEEEEKNDLKKEIEELQNENENLGREKENLQLAIVGLEEKVEKLSKSVNLAGPYIDWVNQHVDLEKWELCPGAFMKHEKIEKTLLTEKKLELGVSVFAHSHIQARKFSKDGDFLYFSPVVAQMTHKDTGKVYQGQWLNKRPSGLGKMYIPDEDVCEYYEGEFLDGKCQGFARMIDSNDGRSVIGEFKLNRMIKER